MSEPLLPPPVQTVEARVSKKRRTTDGGNDDDDIEDDQQSNSNNNDVTVPPPSVLPTVSEQPSVMSTASSASIASASDPRSGSTSGTTTKLVALSDKQRLEKMATACRTILECVGEDPDREGLVKTPERWAKALMFMCSGYHLHPSDVTNGAVFDERHNEMVVVRNIDIHSLCEHHMVPFLGRVHIGYIPNGKIVGLSKLARIAELYARRLQVQERLTRQIADAIVETVQPLGVAVVIESTHLCMVMRGVQKTGALTTTSSVRGVFERNPKTRAEFFSIINGGGPKLC